MNGVSESSYFKLSAARSAGIDADAEGRDWPSCVRHLQGRPRRRDGRTDGRAG